LILSLESAQRWALGCHHHMNKITIELDLDNPEITNLALSAIETLKLIIRLAEKAREDEEEDIQV
jgi:hypothetical protein